MKLFDPIKIEKIIHSETEQLLEISEEFGLAIWNESDYQIEIDRKESFIVGAKKEENLLGFILVRFILSTTLDKSSESEADILNIGVRKKHQKKGIGNLLLKSFLIKAQTLGIQSVWLEVRKSNDNARQFYHRKGFIEIQERKGLYANPSENAIVMKLQLTELAKNLENKT